MSRPKHFTVPRRSVYGQPMTLEQVGQELGVTRERVRQIEAAALAKLRATCEALDIEPGDVIDEWRRLPGNAALHRDGNSAHRTRGT